MKDSTPHGQAMEGTRYLEDSHPREFHVTARGPHSVPEGLRTVDELIRNFAPDPGAPDSLTVVVEDWERGVGRIGFADGRKFTFCQISLRVPLTFHATTSGLAFRTRSGPVLMDWCDVDGGEGHRQLMLNAVLHRNEIMDIRPSAPLTYHITEMMRKEKESVDIALEERERRLLAIYANRASSEVLVADLQVDYNLSDESVLKVIRRLEDEGKIRKQSKKTRRYDKINDEDDLRVIHSQLSNPRQQKKFP